jgi:hypothetical protein
VGFESGLSPSISGVVVPRGDLAKSGRRVLTVTAVPNYYVYQPTSTVLNVRPGQTYVFTGIWKDSDRVVLVPSALPPEQPY